MRIALAVVCVAFASGCALTHPQDLNYRVDTRLHFLLPASRSLIHTPVTVRWDIRDFRLAGPGTAPPTDDAGYFAVFVDRAPIKPGASLRAVAAGDRACVHQPGCPDETYLEQRRVYTTVDPTITLPLIPPLAGHAERVQYHAITVILIDTSGHRVGESAWELDVRLRKLGL